MIPIEIQQAIVNLLEDKADFFDWTDVTNIDEIDFQPLFGDGSSRKFIRVFSGGKPCCLAVAPASSNERDYAEFRSSLAIARHLHGAGIPVPQVYAADTGLGLILFEDLGDTRLHDLVRNGDSRTKDMYSKVVETLAHMQVVGAKQFDPVWCYDTESYDRAVMLERESGYFYQSFWKETLFGEDVDGLEEEFQQLAALAMEYFEPLFLHRDFQSRNIMIKDDNVRIIDFQAGRQGPPGYDIASLLIDPYVSFSQAQQDELFDLYLEEMASYSSIDARRIRASYPYLAIQRNLQIIGAFSYLSGQKRKSFFQPFLIPSLIMLQNRLSAPIFDVFPLLRKTAAEAFNRYRKQGR